MAQSMNLSERSARFYSGRSMAPRILAAGLLPHPQLRCSSCQGPERLTHIYRRLRPQTCMASKWNSGRIPIPLLGLGLLSHVVTKIEASDSRGSKKSLSVALNPRTGAEGQQEAFR